MPVTELTGQMIRIGRAIKGWSQRELAEISGMKPWRAWALENSVYAPRSEEVSRILKALSTGD